MIFLLIIIGINGSVEYSDLCTPIFGIFLGILVGIFFGIVYYYLLKSTNTKNNIGFFMHDESDFNQCRKKGERKFKCRKPST